MSYMLGEQGRQLLDELSLSEGIEKAYPTPPSESSKRLAKRQISEGTYNLNTPGVYDVKLQRIDFVGARKPGIVPLMWKAEEDEALRIAVEKHGEKNWRAVADEVPGRNHLQCLQRWKKALRPGLVKGHWSKEEDDYLLSLINEYTEKGSIGSVNWAIIAGKIEGRNPKQCRERWFLNLDPSINRGAWTAEEDRRLLELAAQCGGRWSLISKNMVGRTENAVKTRFHSLQRQEARGRNWAADEDLALINAAFLFGRDWSKIVKQLPGRSRGQVKKRFAVLAQNRPKLIVEVQAVEERLQKGLISAPILPPQPVQPEGAQYLQSVLANGHKPTSTPSPSVPQWGNPPPVAPSYYANVHSAPGPANLSSSQQLPTRTKGLGQRYGSSLSFLDNYAMQDAAGVGGNNWPTTLINSGVTDFGSLAKSGGLLDTADFDTFLDTTPMPPKKLAHQDTTQILNRILLEGDLSSAQPPGSQGASSKGLKHYGSSWGSMGGGMGDFGFLAGAPDTTVGSNMLNRSGSSHAMLSKAGSQNWTGHNVLDNLLQ